MAGRKSPNTNTKRIAHKAPPRRLRLVAGLSIVLAVALGGAYYVGFGAASGANDYHGNMHFITDEITDRSQVQAQPGMQYTTHIGGSITNDTDSPMQAIVVISYDTTAVDLLSTTCNHAPGCFVSQLNTANQPWGEANLHEHRLAVCLNGPSNARGEYGSQDFLTLKFKAKADFNAVYRNWISIISGSAPNSCAANITATGYAADEGYGNCAANDYACDRGVDPGTGFGSLIGFSVASSSSSSTSSSSSSVAQSNNSSKKSSAATSTKASSTAATLPASTDQGSAKDQKTITPSPFYDGKQYASGSNTRSIFGTLTVADHRVPYGKVIIMVIILALAAAGIGLWYWKRTRLRPAKKAARQR